MSKEIVSLDLKVRWIWMSNMVCFTIDFKEMCCRSLESNRVTSKLLLRFPINEKMFRMIMWR